MNRYIVFGHGRTGTNWVKDTLKLILGGDATTYYEVNEWAESITAFPILHSNLSDVITAIDPTLREQSKLIVCLRDPFSVLISLNAANYTNEWYHYTEKVFDPITIDCQWFMRQVVRYIEFTQINLLEIPKYFDNRIVVHYEDLHSSNDKERFLADKVGIAHNNKNAVPDVQRNPRDYAELIGNYQELLDHYNNYISRKPISWLNQI